MTPQWGKLYKFHNASLLLVLTRVPSLTPLSLSVRNKREAQSYVEISESLGVDKPSEILFVTDVYQEAVAAKAAGNLCSYSYWDSEHPVGIGEPVK